MSSTSPANCARLCQRAVNAGVSFSVFKQESWAAALVHVQDVHAGRQPSIRSDAPFYRLLAYCPRPGMALGALGISPSCPGVRRTGKHGRVTQEALQLGI